MSGFELADLLGVRDDVEVRSCRGCGHAMQQDRRKVAGWEALPGVRRHESDGRCQRCAQVRRGDNARRRATQRKAPTSTEMLALLTAEIDWMGDASCAGAPRPDAFAVPHAYRGEGPTSDAVVAARRYCTRCPVLDECGRFAEVMSESWVPMTGLWGGEWRTGVRVTPITTKAPA